MSVCFLILQHFAVKPVSCLRWKAAVNQAQAPMGQTAITPTVEYDPKSTSQAKDNFQLPLTFWLAILTHVPGMCLSKT